MAESFICDFHLMWCFDDLRENEFMKFKELLKQEAVQRGLQPIPLLELFMLKPQGLASLMMEHYGQQPAWDLALSIFPKIHRKDLCEKARRESAKHAYQAHIQRKFSSMWSRDSFTEIRGSFDQAFTQEESESLDEYFTSNVTRRPDTVVLHGIPRIGKTRFLMKLMLAWSHGILYRDRFSFIFYFCCRELKQLRVTSLAELICREGPNDSVPLEEIVAQPERLLFIIDSFEELHCTLSEPESELCRDWREKRPVKAVLGSLLRRKILSESALLLATMPEHPPALEKTLEHPNMQVLMGFHESQRKQYFCSSFEDEGQAMTAFSLVRNNEQLLSMCQVPLLCWMVCTSLKEEMESGRDLAATCSRTTSVFLSFIFHQFTPKGASHPSQQDQGKLKALCSLAVEGMWTDTWVFGEEELGRNGVAQDVIPALLDIKLFRKYSESGSSYSFMHMCLQEFCAAMFYLLDSPRPHPCPAVEPKEALLLTFLKKERATWVFVGCFLLGLIKKSEQQRLDALLGIQRSWEVEPQLLDCLRSLVECEDLKDLVEFLLLFYSLFEMQSDTLASQLMSGLQEVHFRIHETPDLAVAAYCLKYCSSLRQLSVSVPEAFQEERGPDAMSSPDLLWWRQICSVLSCNEHLQTLRVEDSILDKWALLILCHHLKQHTCPVQRLETSNFSICGETKMFFEVLTSNPNLQHLSLNNTEIMMDDMTLLCGALSNPMCNIQELLLQDSSISPEDCKILASMLVENRKLKLLDLTENNLEEGLPALCAALCHPECTLQRLVMTDCHLTGQCCPHLAEVLVSNPNLSHLDLSRNALCSEGVAVLCEALGLPTCSLQTLCLESCWITPRGCEDLAFVLASNPNLRTLEIGDNFIGDDGVKVLSRALLHPSCGLNKLRLNLCQLTEACCEDLASVIARSRTLHELNLTGNVLGHSGMMQLCEAVRQPGRVLRELRMSKATPHDSPWAHLTVENPPSCMIIVEDWHSTHGQLGCQSIGLP